MDIQFEPAQQPDNLNHYLETQIYLVDKVLEWEERFPEAYEVKNHIRATAKGAFKQIAHIQKLIKQVTEEDAGITEIDDSGIDGTTGQTGGQTETD